MIEMKVTGITENILRLRNIGPRVHENARKTMHAAADRIVALARKMAPVDEGNLEAAIQKQIAYDASNRGRLMIDVVILSEVNGVAVEDYATFMHEGVYKLGPKSEAKQAREGVVVGRGFLDRAAEPEKEKLQQRMIGVVDDAIKRES